jgi:DNA-binding response OmpR family regulator
LYPYKVLVVDDNESFRRFLISALQEEGFQASGAASGKQAMDRVIADKPHVMIVDLVMPEIGGLEVCKTIKNDPFLKDIILIVLSGTQDVDTKLICFATGVNEYLVKPVETRELVARINRFMSMVEEIKNAAGQTASSLEIPEPLIPFSESESEEDRVSRFRRTWLDRIGCKNQTEIRCLSNRDIDRQRRDGPCF